MERNLQELEMQFNYISMQIEQAQRQQVELQSAFQEVQEAIRAIEQLNSGKTFVSLGADAYVPAKLENKEVIASIGANVFSVKSPAEAKEIMQQKAARISTVLSNIDNALNKMLQLRQQLVQQAQEIQKA